MKHKGKHEPKGNQIFIKKLLLFVYSRPFYGLEDLERERIVERRRGI